MEKIWRGGALESIDLTELFEFRKRLIILCREDNLMSTTERETCLLCSEECTTYRLPSSNATEYQCTVCGKYIVDGLVDHRNHKILASMFYYLLHKRPPKAYVYFVRDDAGFDDNDRATYIDVKTLERLYPNNFSQRHRYDFDELIKMLWRHRSKN